MSTAEIMIENATASTLRELRMRAIVNHEVDCEVFVAIVEALEGILDAVPGEDDGGEGDWVGAIAQTFANLVNAAEEAAKLESEAAAERARDDAARYERDCAVKAEHEKKMAETCAMLDAERARAEKAEHALAEAERVLAHVRASVEGKVKVRRRKAVPA